MEKFDLHVRRYQQGELFYDEEITKKSRQSIEEVPKKVERKKKHNYPNKMGKLTLEDKSTSRPQE